MFKPAAMLLLSAVAWAVPVQAAVVPLPASNGVAQAYPAGYWFTAPTDFTITGVTVTGASGTTRAQIISFSAPPPAIGTLTNSVTPGAFTTVANLSGFGPGKLAVSVQVKAGDIIGTLGYYAGGTEPDQPAANCPCIPAGAGGLTFTSAITNPSGAADLPVTLTSFWAADSLGGQPTYLYSGAYETNSFIGLIELEYTVPEAPSLALAAAGLGVLGLLRRRALPT